MKFQYILLNLERHLVPVDGRVKKKLKKRRKSAGLYVRPIIHFS